MPGAPPGNRILVEHGVAVEVAGADARVQGNEIVFTPSPLPGAAPTAGIAVLSGAEDALVGGAGAGNRVAGLPLGILALGSGTRVSDNRVEGISGDPSAVGIDAGGADVLVLANVVTGASTGLRLAGLAQAGGNLIGTDETGADGLGNRVGVRMSGGLLGGAAGGEGCTGACNVIAGNGTGVEASGGTIQGNYIGWGPGLLPVPNDGAGVEIESGLGPVTVGETGPGEGNLIAHNGGAGVMVVDGEGHAIRGNRIHSDGGLGIDLLAQVSVTPDGVTPNDGRGDPDTGANGLQNFPEELVATRTPGGLRVTGRVPMPVDSPAMAVDVYASAECDPSGYGEGATHLGVATADPLTTDGAFDAVVAAPPAGFDRITATATGPEGTSELSACVWIGSVAAGETALTAPVTAGATALEVASTDGFLGKVVQVGEGATAETNYVTALGSLVLARPLRFAHAAGEPVVALEDTLFVSVDRAAVRFPRWSGGDRVRVEGKLRPVEGRQVACGEAVTVTFGGFSQTIAGSELRVKRDGRCGFERPRGTTGVTRLVLDLRRATFELEARDDVELAGLTNPVTLGLAIGDDAGSETLTFVERRRLWTYGR